MTVDYRTGDVLDVIRDIPDGTVDLVATSPPFLALRNYNDIDGQWGSEPTPAAFIDNLLELVVECRRVLAPHGSIAFELGDTYSGSGGAGGDYADGGLREQHAKFSGSASRTREDGNGKVYRGGQRMPDKRGASWPLAKSLCGIPTLFAWSLAYGRNLLNPAHELEPWRIRNVIVWARNNPPVGALGDKVRPATSYITVACPSDRRWFDLDAVRDRSKPTNPTPRAGRKEIENPDRMTDTMGTGDNPAGAPPLDHWHDEPDGDLTWLINTQGSNLGHYAMWPPRLAERLVLSMCPAEVCRQCGEPRRRIVEKSEEYQAHRLRSSEAGTNMRAERVALGMAHGGRGSERMDAQYATLGWSDCGHGDYRPGVVLDPFAGTGTTLAVADIHGRDAIGIDLDPANPALYPSRYEQCWKALDRSSPSPVTEHGQQLDLLAQETTT